MAKKVTQQYSNNRRAGNKFCHVSFNSKESASLNILVPFSHATTGSTRCSLKGNTASHTITRNNPPSGLSSSHVGGKKPGLIAKPDSTNNSRLCDRKTNAQIDKAIIIPQASVRIRKRKSCATVSRNKRPGIPLDFDTVTKREILNEDYSKLIPAHMRRRRMDHVSQSPVETLTTAELTTRTERLYRATDRSRRSVSMNEKDSNRYHVFSYDQVKRLDRLLQMQLCISPRPTQWDCGLMPSLCSKLTKCYSSLTTTRSAQFQRTCLDPPSNKQATCDSHGTDKSSSCSKVQTQIAEPIMNRGEPSISADPGICMPIVNVQLKQLIRTIRDRLIEEQITVREIRLNGGAAGCVINLEEEDNYGDLDVIFNVDLSNFITFTKIKSVIFSSIAQFLADTFAGGNLIYGCTSSATIDGTSSYTIGKNHMSVSTRNGINATSTIPTHSPNSNVHANTIVDRQKTNGQTTDNSQDGKDSEQNCANSSNHLELASSTSYPASNTRLRTRCSHSFTSSRDTDTPTASGTHPSGPHDRHNRRASDHSINLGPRSDRRIKFADSSAPVTTSTAETKNGYVKNLQLHNSTAMMMALRSCFFPQPFHFVHCPQTWSGLLRDESVVKQYIQKMVRIHKPSSKTADSWSLFTLGYRTPDGGKTVDVKFVDRMQRPFEFTVDSFQIVLDGLLAFYETSRQAMNEHFYPTVVAESVAGSFTEALSHLKDRLIATPRPEEIHGGGLLKYCKLLVDGYRPSSHTDVLSMERYMCSRFFIDFPDIFSQHQRLTYYLTNHFDHSDKTKATYLQILHEVVSHSTVCLMTHERQQTLCLIRMLLQDFLSRSEASKSVVHLEEFSSDNWALDSVGTFQVM